MLSLAAGLSGLPNKVIWKLQAGDMPGENAHCSC